MLQSIDMSPLWKVIQSDLSQQGYTLKQPLSQKPNANAQVWLADYQHPGGVAVEQHALKIASVFLLDHLDGIKLEKLEKRTQQEIALAQKMDHPNIPKYKGSHKVSYHDAAVVDVLAMEYIHAPNILTGIEQRRALPEDAARKVLEDTLSALEYIHTSLGQPVLHRDIKPSNILFDGKKAYLFDFNFSKIDDGTSASTVIDNYGYYPADTYSGRQTPSQDLVALGNTIIAAVAGEEISDLRLKQEKAAFAPIDIQRIAVSPHLRKFLQKLTAENPAYRYQNAHQALAALQKLDEMSEEQLEQQAATITRSENVKGLLAKLAEHDHLFNYNVPPNILATHDDDALTVYLERTYHQPAFIIEDPGEIRRYARRGDRVVKKGLTADMLLGSGFEGKIKKVDGENITVAFFKEKRTVHIDDLLVVGDDRSWLMQCIPKKLDKSYPARDFRYKIGRTIDKEGYWKDDLLSLCAGLRVQYVGEPVYGKRMIPDRSEGIIDAISNDSSAKMEIAITWLQRPGLRDPVRTCRDEDNIFHIHHPYLFSPEDVKLVVDNYVPFDALVKEAAQEKNAAIIAPLEKTIIASPLEHAAEYNAVKYPSIRHNIKRGL